jgi:hypothetical protein
MILILIDQRLKPCSLSTRVFFYLGQIDGANASSFRPYDPGFTGRYGDPFTTYTMEVVNEGAAGTQDYPRLYQGVAPIRKSCAVCNCDCAVVYCDSANLMFVIIVL